MNNTSTGSVRATNKLIPVLRFPEFVNEGEWDKAILAELSEVITKGTTPTTLGFSYTDKGVNFIKIESIEDGRINLSKAAFISDECNEALKRSQLRENDILFSIAGALGVIAPVSERELPANTNQALSIIRLKKEYNKDYIIKFLLSPEITSEIYKLKAGAAQLNISLSQVGNFRILLPKNPQEQHKIASCLSSLDEVIAAYSQKLKALRDHKKGLMQNLFPQEGETVPKWRFKDFVNDGKWVEKKLGDIGEPLMCKRIFKEETTNNATNGIPFYKIGTFGGVADSFIPIELYNQYKSKYSFPKIGEILISAAGTIGRLVVYDGSPAYFQDSNIVWLGNDEALVLNSFLFHSYSKLKWQTSDGGIISRLYNSDLKSMKILLPNGKIEQQKIADCLSSLDALTTAQVEKIEVLKLHKKGLMQCLFPKIND